MRNSLRPAGIILINLVTALVFATCAAGDEPSASLEQRLSLIKAVQGLPVEYRADIVLSAVEKQPELLHYPSVRRSVNGIFEAASSARRTYPMSLTAQIQGDSVETQLSADLSTQRLDTMSIRLRVVKIFNPSQPAISRQMFWKIQTDPPRTECEVGMVPNLSGYYQQLAESLGSWQNAVGTGQDILASELVEHIRVLNSPLAMAPLADAISKMKLTQANLQQVASAYEAYVSRAEATDRELAALIQRDQLIRSVRSLAILLKSQGLSAQPVLLGIRKVLLGSSSRGCMDTVMDRRKVVQSFNSMVDEFGLDQSRLSLAELSPKTAGVAAVERRIGPDAAISGPLTNLQHFWERQASGQAILDQIGWEDSAKEVLRYADSLDDHDGCAECLFLRKFLLYFSVANFAPKGHLAQAGLSKFTEFLASTPVRFSEPEAWIAKIKLFLNFSRYNMDDTQAKRIASLQKQGRGLMDLPTPDGKVVLNEMRYSQDPIVSAYYRNELVFKPKFSSPY